MRNKFWIIILALLIGVAAGTGCAAYLRQPNDSGTTIRMEEMTPEKNTTLEQNMAKETGDRGTQESAAEQNKTEDTQAEQGSTAEQSKTEDAQTGQDSVAWPDRLADAQKEQDSGTESDKLAGQSDADGTQGSVRFNAACSTIATRFYPPDGFARVEADGFGDFLREYPLLEDGAAVLLHDGSKKWNQDAHAAVFDMDVVQGDLQQCADSCIRLYAEYFYNTGKYEKIAFHLVNGFLVDFDTWRAGGRVAVEGNQTEWVMSAEPSDSWETFEKYLRFVFTYASTLSMDRESESIDIRQIRAGDLFIKGGSPGHVVMVLDVCENDAGEKAFLLGQGYMPAQQFHVLKNPAHAADPWYYVSEVEYPFVTPEYVFSEGSFKRPAYD